MVKLLNRTNCQIVEDNHLPTDISRLDVKRMKIFSGWLTDDNFPKGTPVFAKRGDDKKKKYSWQMTSKGRKGVARGSKGV